MSIKATSQAQNIIIVKTLTYKCNQLALIGSVTLNMHVQGLKLSHNFPLQKDNFIEVYPSKKKTVLNFSGLNQNFIITSHIPLPAPATTDHKSSLELTKAAAH